MPVSGVRSTTQSHANANSTPELQLTMNSLWEQAAGPLLALLEVLSSNLDPCPGIVRGLVVYGLMLL